MSADTSRPRRVALFVSCAADLAMQGPVEATVDLLEAAGIDVEVPEAQTCCGQMALNSGHPGPATELMRRWIEVFEPYDAVVSPSGSCTATVHHQFPRVLDGAWSERAEDLAARTYELTQFLVAYGDRLSTLDLALDATVAWHDSCHMLRSLHEKNAPRTMLAGVRGLTVVDVRDSEVCCGFGGTFATKFPELSCAMGDRKLNEAIEAGVSALVSADPGCLLHLGGRAERTGRPLRVLHVAELLRAALTGAGLASPLERSTA